EHRFPVDITIPFSRIERLDDIYVDVESFDYTIPETNCLRLVADISIVGMAQEEEAREEPVSESHQSESEATDLTKDPLNVRAEEDDSPFGSGEPIANDQEPVFEPFHYEARREPTEEERVTADPHAAPQEERGPLVEMKSRIQEDDYDYVSDEGWEDYEEEQVGNIRDEEYEAFDEEEDEPSHSRKEENALYLTKMMTNEDEGFSRLKMCIIQHGESLDTIAQRYELPLTQLLRVNGLDNEDVTEGQILYIPVSSS
ncbi:MAG TPA: stage VI sporulation protein D, partial [Bacillales bacterium]|nr:stage VI sporulation protein D [Bacillales bacterium]